MPDSPKQRPRPVARHKWLELHADAAGEPYLVAPPRVLVVPLNYAGEVLCVQERPQDGARLALPGSMVDQGDHPLRAAKRALQAETGFKAEAWFPLGMLALFESHAQWDVHLFLARNLEPARSMAAAIYQGATARVPLDSVEAAIASGRLRDATTIAALFMARQAINGALRIDPGETGNDDG